MVQHIGPYPLVYLVLSLEAYSPLADALLDDVLQTVESATADEKYVGGIELDELLMRMLPSPLRRNIGDGPFKKLEQRLLDALPGNVPRDRRAF